MSTKKNYKEIENLRERGKKKYQERLIEEKEAKKLIRDTILEDDIEYDPVKLQLDKDGV